MFSSFLDNNIFRGGGGGCTTNFFVVFAPVGGRSRVTELPCYTHETSIL